jgi:RHH-type transcriptional regulator, proline utilization regulon repressor / proline dehydrogenase / delta 1-pyrroline-5-carboxylate dehydrogenase
MRERDASQTRSQAQSLLDRLRARGHLDSDELADVSVELAALLFDAAEREQGSEERERAAVLARLMDDPDGQVFTTLLADRVFRSADHQRIVDAARQLLRALGVPRYLPPTARLALTGLLRLGPFAPKTAARGVLDRLRRETRHVVLPAEDPELHRYLERRRSQGVRVNVNKLGEAVLSEAEAERRVASYVELLSRPDIDTISVKVSSIFSQIDLLAWDETLCGLLERLRVIYRAALAHGRKLVTLDMESYRDLHLTLAAFRGALSEPEFKSLSAGIVLQAYLPDSAALQRELTEWATARVKAGGAPIRLRVVKGANLLSERVEAAARGFAMPVFPTKAEVDQSFKKMIDYGCQPAHAAAVRLGVASHNLFDIALAMVLRALRGVEAEVGFELLEGMADPLARAVLCVAGDVLLYAPVCEPASMHTAIAYLTRRLDENTAEQNFLRHSFGLRVGSAAWLEQERQFRAALQARFEVSETPAAAQSRPALATGSFANEPDIDFSLGSRRAWIREILAGVRDGPCLDIPLQVGGELRAGVERMDGFDPSRPGLVPYRFGVADRLELERAVDTASQAASEWGKTSIEERAALLAAIAGGLRAARGELIAAMVLDAGKRVEQADTEVSEAVDFAEYYAQAFAELAREHPELEWRPAGTVLVTPPWNFPLAIAAGGVFAALMGGNAVILKPALETVLVAARLAETCWSAGVPKTVLQFVPTPDERGSALIRDPRVSRVLLTGATSTAQLFHSLRRGLQLCAETGGKNAIIVTATADRDEAIKDVLISAFGHAGQKCSACSLLICEAEVYDDPGFLETLRDAAASLPVGSSWDPRSVVTPLIHPARDPLLAALTRLEPGEQWLLAPRRDPANPRLWSPGIKLGVREGSPSHVTELFGPVLAVMRAEDLDDALRLANATPYGLTSGLHSLDEHEQGRWSEAMAAGNLYINRPITGAIVRRQPFGGWKASSFGPGAKAGGPNYVGQTTLVMQREAPAVACAPSPPAAELAMRVRAGLGDRERERLSIGLCSYAQALRDHFACDQEQGSLLGERNVLRYRPCASILVRACVDADPVDVLLAVGAVLTAGAACALSVDPGHPRRDALLGELAGVLVESEPVAACVRRLRPGAGVTRPERVRVIGAPESELIEAAAHALVHVEGAPVLLTGRIELLRYHREQSISHRYHRYGNLAPGRLLPAAATSA